MVELALVYVTAGVADLAGFAAAQPNRSQKKQ
jgi:hypothetical protein